MTCLFFLLFPFYLLSSSVGFHLEYRAFEIGFNLSLYFIILLMNIFSCHIFVSSALFPSFFLLIVLRLYFLFLMISSSFCYSPFPFVFCLSFFHLPPLLYSSFSSSCISAVLFSPLLTYLFFHPLPLPLCLYRFFLLFLLPYLPLIASPYHLSPPSPPPPSRSSRDIASDQFKGGGSCAVA